MTGVQTCALPICGDAGIVETYISYLRKKIDTYEPALIHTVRGVGYRLRMPAKK